MALLGIITNILGIGKNALENRAKIKQLKAKQEFSIIEAQTQAQVKRIVSNSDSDNQIDMITAQNKKYTLKDEVVTYLFLVPVFVATIVPFISAYESGDYGSLNKYILESYNALDSLPSWYKYVLAAVVVDVLGFRSFARRILDKYIKKPSAT